MSEMEFKTKFKELNDKNKNYIIAIQQALIFAQSEGKQDKKKEKAGV